jgi:TonB-dependent starch-binding outer membrane protein SusC
MRKILLPLLLISILPTFILAQEIFTIKGKVTDAKTGEPLIGASILLKPSNLGAASDFDGNYSFDVPKNLATGQSAELSASFINYKKKTAKVTLSGSNITQNFAMEEDIFQSQEIVITGVASKTSKEVAEVAVARINAKELTSVQNYQSVNQLLSGKMSGVNILTGSGNVGGGWRMFIRGGAGLNGNEQPVYYLDGVRLDNVEFYGFGVGGQGISTLSNLNPNDIEDIQVLKGPAASASYGTNASNGVVLITTKRGKLVQGLGKSVDISYTFDYGINTPSFKYGDNWLNKDHINAVLDAPGYIQEHTLQVSGGNQLLRYYTSFSSRLEKGLIPAQNLMDRKSLKANISAFPSESFNLTATLQYTWNKIARPNDDNNTWGWMLNALCYYPAYLNVDSTSLAAESDITKFNDIVGGVKASWKPIENLELSGAFGITYRSALQDQYYPWGYKYGSYTTGIREIFSSNTQRFSYDLNAKYYLKLLDKLNLTAIAGAQLNNRIYSNLDGQAVFFNHPNITTLQTGDPNNLTAPDNSYAYEKSAGIYGETDWSWDDTYFWTLMVRKDYANAFGSEAPNIIYPKASAAIRVDKLDFLPLPLPSEINMLKLRFAYGESGQLPGRLDGLPLTWTATQGANGTGIIPNSLGNPAIEPERIKEYELGLDVEFLKMASLEFTYYHTDASGSIIYSPPALSYGYLGSTLLLTYPYNVGRVTGHGFETQLQINPIRSADYDLNLTFMWNYQKSEILDLGTSTTEIVNGYNSEKVGYRKHEFFAYKSTTPIFSSTTQKLTGFNQTATTVDCGNPVPDHSGSFSVNFRFLKNFTFNAFCEFGFNNYIYSYTTYRALRAGSYAPANILATKLGIVGVSTFGSLRTVSGVTPLTPGTQEYIDAANEFAKYYQRDAGNFILPADYFAIREVSLCYDLTDIIKQFSFNQYITSLNVGFSVRNVFRTSKYELDYEANYSGGAGTNVYETDMGTLPQPRTYNFWVKFGF